MANIVEVTAFVKFYNKGVQLVGDEMTDSIVIVIEDLVTKWIFHKSILKETKTRNQILYRQCCTQKTLLYL